MASSKDGAIEIAVNNGYVFTNASNDDLLIRTTTSNQSIHFGTYSNDKSAMYINSNSVTITSNLYIANYFSVGTSNTFSRVNIDGGLNMTGDIYKNNNLYITDSNTVLGLFKVGLPIKKQFQAAATRSNFTITMTGDFTADVTAMDVYRNGNKLAYVDSVTNDYVLNVIRSGLTTDFTISLGQNVSSGDVVDITIWPSMSNFFAQNTFIAACNLTPFLSGFNSNNLQVVQTLRVGNAEATEALTVSSGNALFNSNVYILKKLGIGSSNPTVSLDIIGTDSILLPKGTTAQRPGAPVQGYVRYNTDINTFEGYGAGNAWGSLGGVKDTNQDTYIGAELFPTSNDDVLRFINSNNESMRILRSGFVGISNVTPSERLELNGGNAKFNSNVYVLSRLGVGGSNPAYAVDVIGTINASSSVRTSMIQSTSSTININDFYGYCYTGDTLHPFQCSNSALLVGYKALGGSYAVGTALFSNIVGIGTAAPGEALDVGGNIKASGNIYAMTNLGVGTSNPSLRLEVNGSARINSNMTVMGNLTVSGVTTTLNSTTITIADNMLTLNNGATFNSTLQAGVEVNRGTGYSNYYFVFDETTKYFKVGQTGGLQTVATREDSPAANGVIPYYDSTGFQYLSASTFVYSGGKVGINQASPSFTLDVGGTIRSTASGADGIILNSGGSFSGISFSNNRGAISTIGLAYNPGQFSLDASSNDLIIRNTADIGKIILHNGSTGGGITVNSNNLIGIGTNVPTSKLHVIGNCTVRNTTDNWQTIISLVGDTGSNAYSFNLGNSANTAVGTNGMGVYDGNTAINRFVTVWKAGNLGIGTTSPGYILDINGNTPKLRIQSSTNTAGQDPTFSLWNTGNQVFNLGYSHSGGYNYFQGATNDIMRLYNNSNMYVNGKIGVNTLNPSCPISIGPSFSSNVGISIDINGANAAALTTRYSSNNPAFSIVPLNLGEVYLSYGIYYENNGWVAAGGSTNGSNCVFSLSQSSGAKWYASDNSNATLWNVANKYLWNVQGNWSSLLQSTSTGNSYITGGNLGIGTNNPTATLEVSGSVKTSGSLVVGSADNTSLTMIGNIGFIKKYGASSVLAYNNINPFKICMLAQADISTAISTATVTDRLIIDNSGNLGIGTSSPVSLFNVDGGTYSAGTYPTIGHAVINYKNPGGMGGSLVLRNSTGASTLGSKAGLLFELDGSTALGTDGTDLANAAIFGVIESVTNSVTALVFNTWNGTTSAERMRLTNNGILGIGTSSPHSQAKLHLSGTGILNQLHFSATDQATDTKNWVFGPNASNFYGYLYNDAYNATVNWLQVTRSGNTVSSVNFPNGPVGIGTTTTPNSGVVKLEVSSTSATYLRISGATANQQALEFYDTTTRWLIYKPNNGTDLRWYNGSTDVMTIMNNGNLGLGISTASYKLHVVGDIYASADMIAYSDARIKTDLQRITNAVEKIKKINGYTFKRTDLYEEEPHKRHTGLIAQEVQNVLPEAVHTDSEDRLSIAYGNMAGIIIEAIKELKEELMEIKRFIGM